MRRFAGCGFVLWSALLLGAPLGCTDGGTVNSDGPFVQGESIVVDVSPNLVVFPTVNVGEAEQRSITITHVGTSGTLRIEDVSLSAETSEDITFTGPAVTALAPGESTELTVIYAPSDGEADAGTLRIDTNAPISGGTGIIDVSIQTLAQTGALVGFPNPLNFGGVQAGTTEVRTLTISNFGAQAIAMESFSIYGSGVADFEVVTSPEVPAELAPGDTITVELSYSPSGGDTDDGYLVMGHLVDGAVTYFEHSILGHEVVAILSTFPDPMDFGECEPGVTHTLPLNLSNQGDNPLTLTHISLTDWSIDAVSLENVPPPGLVLEQGDFVSLDVVFTPPEDMVPTPSAIAGIAIASNDVVAGDGKVVSVFGGPMTPSLQVNPPDLLEFGYVAQQLTTLRKVALFNGGNADLAVSSITVEGDANGEFVIQPDESWAPTAASPSAGVLGPGEHREVKVLFTNKGGDTGTAWASLRILSDDGNMPDWSVDLKAMRAGQPSCELQIVPAQVDYGIVPRGFTKTMSVSLVNVGSGNCSFHSAFVNDCGGWMGFFGTSCPDPSTTVMQSGDSAFYTVLQAPPAIQEGIAPGQSYDIEVQFVPPETAPIFGDDMTDYAGYLGVRYIDPYAPVGAGASPEIKTYPEPSGGSWASNLHAKSGFADLSVFPMELDFGIVTIGCYSQTLTVSAYNIGTAPLDLTSWELVGCSPEFQMKAYPGLPVTLQPQDGVEFQVVYVPQDEGTDNCSLALTTSDSDTPAAVVPLLGAGTFETAWTDEFIQVSGQAVDVLFVVDDSGSMSEEQGNLAANFSNFIAETENWNNLFHVGVVTMDAESTGGRLQGDPRYIQCDDACDMATGTPSTCDQCKTDNTSVFQQNVSVGTNGSGTEQGLLAAQMALSLPNTANTNQACASDAECTEPERCWDGFCGGPNRGFMRQDAALEVVFVSDEEDQSPADLSFYESFFKSIKGYYNANMLHLHAIVGPAGGCSSSNGDADAGHRYMDLANATGGNVISICEPDFASGLQSIGEIAFGLKLQFFLTRVAEPSTIEVKVADVPCASTSDGNTNWSYDAASNSVVFNENGGCLPQPGDLVWIHYETICYLE